MRKTKNLSSYTKTGIQRILNKDNIFVIFIVIFSVVIRVSVSLLGHNTDVQSFHLVASIIRAGESVYADTHRYNYGPIWSYILWIFSYTRQILDFHVSIALFLSITDLLVAFVLYKVYGKITAVLYLLNPVSILITGYHSQFDNLALLFALISWYYFLSLDKKKFKDLKLLVFSSILLGISLVIKHLMYVFPIWLAFYYYVNRKYDKRLSYIVAIPYVVFGFSFLIEILRFWEIRFKVIQGIFEHVFSYQGIEGSGFILKFLDLFSLSNFFTIDLTQQSIFLSIILLIAGYLLVKRNFELKYLLPVYLLILFSFSTSIAEQYLAVPLIAVSVFYFRWESLIFVSIAAYYLLTALDNANLGGLIFNKFNFEIFNTRLQLFVWSLPITINIIFTQFILMVLSLRILFLKQIVKLKLNLINFLPIILIIFVYFIINISVFWYLIYNYKIDGKIELQNIAYQSNCESIDSDKFIQDIIKMCRDKSECEIMIPDLSIICYQDLYISWKCRKDALFQLEFWTAEQNINKEKVISINCTKFHRASFNKKYF